MMTIAKEDLPIQISAMVLTGKTDSIPGPSTFQCDSSASADKSAEQEESERLATERLFKTLSLQTDINIAPVNWLRGDKGNRGE